MKKTKTNDAMDKAIAAKLYVKNDYGYAHAHPGDAALAPAETAYLKQYGMKTEYLYKDKKARNGVPVPIHPMCISCQARHILKYKDHSEVRDNKPFQVSCTGVPGVVPPGTKELISKFMTQNGLDRERAELVIKSAVDPVSWAELMFGFSDNTIGTETPKYLRWYQKEQLRCSAKRIVLREGRRSGKTFIMALKLLYYIFSYTVSKGPNADGQEEFGGPQIIVVTPFQAQLINIFNELEKLLRMNSTLAGQVTSSHGGNLYIKSPFFQMIFDNGGKISGFVTGVEVRQDGNAGGALRGQSADIIYIDEMDAIHEDILDKVIIPILATWEHTMLFATSTPIGKVGKFFDFCKNRPDFREDYLPTTVLPHWNTVKAEIKNLDPGNDTFISEYMAEFVENSHGVFKSSYIYSALADYSYKDSQPDSPWWSQVAKTSARRDNNVIVVGIDWNKNAGSEFVVVNFDMAHERWWVCEAKNISPGQFNSILFKDEVRRINHVWKPDFIYADEGYGHHIIDDLMFESHQLKMMGAVTPFQVETAKLKERLKKFNFSQKVEINNPLDGSLMELSGKDFLVENAIRVFESENLYFPVSDIVLRDQLLNYVVLKRHVSNNKPVYGMRSTKVGDHRLDALMLALGGIFLEKNPVYSPEHRLIQSMPALLTKEILAKRGKREDDSFEGLFPGVQPNMNIEMTRIVRGGSEGLNNAMRAAQKAELASQVPYQRPTTRSDVPWEQQTPSRETYEVRGVKGYNTSTPFDTGQTVMPQNRSNLFAFRKAGRPSRGTR